MHFLLFLLTFCYANAMNSSSTENDVFSLEVMPSLAGNPLHGYRFVVQCGQFKFREYSQNESETVRWTYPMAEPERVEFELPDGRCLNFTVFIFLTRRNNSNVNLWDKQFHTTTSQRNVSVLFHHYAKLAVSPSLEHVSEQQYYVQVRCTRTEKDPNLLFFTHFKADTMVVLLDNLNCVAFTIKLWVLWPNQKQLDKPKMVMENVGLRGQMHPLLKFDFANHFLLEITPRLASTRAYVVYVWLVAGSKKSKRRPMKFVTTMREEWCTPNKCPLRVLINSKGSRRGTTPTSESTKTVKTPPIYDIAVAEADEDWANPSEGGTIIAEESDDEFPDQLVFHKQYGVPIENGETFSWNHPRRRRSGKNLQNVYYNF